MKAENEIRLLTKEIKQLISVVSAGQANGYEEYFTFLNKDGLPTKMEKNALMQSIFNDVSQIKLEIGAVASKVSDLDTTIQEIKTKSIPEMKTEMQSIKGIMPMTFGNWIKKRAELAKNLSAVFKFLFYTIVTLFIASKSMPAIIKFFTSVLNQG